METSAAAEIASLAEQGWTCRDSDRVRARTLAEQAQQAAESEHPAGQGRALALLAYLDYREARYEAAINRALEALDLLEAGEDLSWLPRAYNIIAITYDSLGERSLSHSYLHRQIELSQKLGAVDGEAVGYHDLAISYGERDPAVALSYMERALQLATAAGLDEILASGYYNLATIYARLGERERAYGYCLKSLALCRTAQVDDLEVYISAELGRLCVELGRPEEGEGYLQAALELARAEFPELIYLALRNMGQAAMHRNEPAAALGFFRDGLALVEPTGHKGHAAQFHQLLIACYEALDDYRAALAHSKTYIALRDLIYGEESEAKVRAMEVAHRTQMARRDAAAERERTAELQRTIEELEALHKTLREWSLLDYLTGIYNRRFLMDSGEQLLAQATRYGSHLCVAMFDVDHFKRINDTYTHRVGDQVLQRIAVLAEQCTREADIVARYGGEEFALLLPETELDSAVTACERLRVAVEQEPWERIAAGLTVTISIGVTEAGNDESFEELLARADWRLYAAKGGGRNQVVA